MFVTFEHRQFAYNDPKRYRADRTAVANVCHTEDFAFTMSSVIAPPWSDATAALCAADRLEAFIRIVDNADLVQSVIDAKYVHRVIDVNSAFPSARHL